MEFPSDDVIRELENREYSIEGYFSKSELAKLSKVELQRYKNMRKNYEIMLAVGLPAVMPEFMKGPRSRGKRKLKKVESDSDEEWTPYKSTREKKQTIRFSFPEKVQKENKPRKIKTEKNTKNMKKTESHTYPLRVQERLNYMDVEVPDDDDFIYCEECNQEHEGDCPIHGPLLVVTDTEIYRKGHPSHFVNAFKEPFSNWMRYVNCARSESEQNLVAFQYKGQIYYRSFKDIPAGTELLVWYGHEYGRELGIYREEMDVPPKFVNGEVFSCPWCDMGFMISYKEYLAKNCKYKHGHSFLRCIKPYTGDDIFRCPYCNVCFSTPDFLKRHKLYCKKKEKENCDSANSDRSYSKEVDNQVKGTVLNIFCRSNVLQSSIVHRKNAVISDTIIKVNSQNKTCNCDTCMTQTVLNKREHLHRHNITQTVNESHQSDVCRKGSLEKYKEVHTSDKPYKCDVCGKAFSHSQNLKSHTRTHTGDKPYKCDVCGKAFSLSQNLKSHMRTHTGEKPYKCDVCGKAFSQSRHLQTHMRTHSGDKPYRCDVCGKAFNDPCNFQKHIRIHTGEKPYKCDVCEKAFTQSSTLHTHMRTHTGVKPYRCDVCGKAFIAPGNLQRHVKTHTDKPWKCDMCGKAFSHSQNLKRHMRTHTGDKPCKCEVCGMAFTLSSSLHAHMRTHTGDKPYKCDVCGKAFSHSQYLKSHMRTHTGEKPYKCDVCGKAFTQSHHLRSHMRTHTGDKPYRCDVCGKAFNDPCNFQKHIRTHTGEKPYKCDVCEKAFTQSSTLHAHMRTHTGVKPYRCDVCGKAFSHSQKLKRHVKTHTGD
ncbi:zinc finger protein 708-like isoform X1 [Saccostrea cucullata]|uniref:zinc finger protein 708-like isoform X1 n=2 Tax=Saccostrea cuccullata TaxID=36930 RepID=UPI002ED43B15